MKVSPSIAAPRAAVIIRVRTKPVSRETSVPAAITALDFSRPEARPPASPGRPRAAAAAPEPASGRCRAGPAEEGRTPGRPPPCCWSRKRWAKASGSCCSLAGLGDQVVHAHVLGGAGVVAVRQVRRRPGRLRGRGLGPDPRVGGVLATRAAVRRAVPAAVRAGRRRGVRGAVVERLGHRVLGGEVLRPVGVLGVGVLEVRVGAGRLRRRLAVPGGGPSG